MIAPRFYALWLLLLVASSCERARGCGERPLAELLEARGEVSRDYRGSEQQWAKAEVGSAFSYGDALRTAKGSLADVRVGKSGRVLVESETIVRFLDHVASGSEPASGLQVMQGSATVEALASALTLRTRSGTAVLEPGTKVLLEPATEADTYRVIVGTATFHQDDGRTIPVLAGHSISIGIGVAVLDDVASPLEAAEREPSEPALSASEDATQPEVQDAGASAAPSEPNAHAPGAALAAQNEVARSESTAELTVRAGESFEVYDPRPPTRIGVIVPERCKQGALLVISGRKPVRSSTVMELTLHAGVHAYRVYCDGSERRAKPERSGRIKVRKSTGVRALPKTAPQNTVELDGHRYRLMYQNLRPVIVVGWRAAPRAPGYTLTLAREGGAPKRFDLREPKFVLDSSLLSDGKQVLVMQAHDAAATRSKPTTLDIAFDNAAPTASLELPPASGFVASELIEVRGIVAPGTNVSVEGDRVKVTPRGTFRHSVALPAGRSALSVRFQHPIHGLRYYVRRVRHARP